MKTKQNNSNFTCTNICSYNSSSYLLQSSSIPEPGYVWQLSKRTFVLISAVACMRARVCVCCSSRCLLTPDSVCFSSRQKWHLILRSCLYRAKSKVTECIKWSSFLLLLSSCTEPVSQCSRVGFNFSHSLSFSPPIFVHWSLTHTHLSFLSSVTPGRKHIKAVNSEFFHIFLAARHIWQHGWTEKLGTVSVQTVQVH